MYKNKLIEWRKKYGMSQAKLMGISKVNQTRISHIENGYIKGTQNERILISKALNAKTVEIFTDPRYENSNKK